MSKSLVVPSSVLLLLLLVVGTTKLHALPDCKYGCFTTTCSLTPADAQGKRYCVKWDSPQSGAGYSAGADPLSYVEELILTNNTGTKSITPCTPDCEGSSPGTKGTSAGCDDAATRWE